MHRVSADIKLQPISCKVLRLVTIVLFIPVGAGSKFLEVDGKPYERLDMQCSFEEINPGEKKAASSKHLE